LVVIALAEPHLPGPWPLVLGWLPVLVWAGVVHALGLGKAEVEFDE
jgi:hypothetical protein